jgi:hypothetical protein
MRALLLSVGLAIGLLSPAGAMAKSVPIAGPAWAQRDVDRMRVPVPPGQIVVVAPCPDVPGIDAAGCNFPTAGSLIYVSAQAGHRYTLYDELGGRFDTLAMYPVALERFARIARLRHVTAAAFTLATPEWDDLAEVFEDAYADCALGLTPRPDTLQHPDNAWIDDAGYRPSAPRHRRVCALIERVGARRGYATPRAYSGGRRRP